MAVIPSGWEGNHWCGVAVAKERVPSYTLLWGVVLFTFFYTQRRFFSGHFSCKTDLVRNFGFTFNKHFTCGDHRYQSKIPLLSYFEDNAAFI